MGRRTIRRVRQQLRVDGRRPVRGTVRALERRAQVI